MRCSTIIISATIVISSVTVFSGLVEILHPAPKVTDYCQQERCIAAARDKLVGTSEDYFGNLFTWLAGVFILGILALAVTIVIKGNPQMFLIEGVLLLDIIVYLILNRFIRPFSWWPLQTWSSIVLILFIYSISILLVKKRKKREFDNNVVIHN